MITTAREDEPSPSPAPTPEPTTQVQQPQTKPGPAPAQPVPTIAQTQTPEDVQAQQQYEYIRALLRGNAPAEAQEELDQDPMKLLNSMLGGMSSGGQGGAAAAAQGVQGAQGTSPGTFMGFSPSEIASMLGLPPFFSSMLEAVLKPDTPEGKKQAWARKMLHAFFAFGLGVYILLLIGSSVATYGSPPPPPATAQNPFLVFVTGELLLIGARILAKSRDGGLVTFGTWVQLFKDVIQDGRIALFVLGMGSWWCGGWKA